MLLGEVRCRHQIAYLGHMQWDGWMCACQPSQGTNDTRVPAVLRRNVASKLLFLLRSSRRSARAPLGHLRRQVRPAMGFFLRRCFLVRKMHV